MTLFSSRTACGLAFFLLLLISGVAELKAQESKPTVFELEVNVGYLGSGVDESITFQTGPERNLVQQSKFSNRLALGVGFRKTTAERWYSRYALMNIASGQSERTLVEDFPGGGASFLWDGETFNYANLRLRYERGRYFLPGKHFRLGLGLMADPIMSFSNSEPINPVMFPLRSFSVGVDAGVNPSVSYIVGKRFRLALEVPIPIVSVAYTSVKTDNPFIIDRERRQSDFSVDLLRNVQAGLSLRVTL